MGNAVIRMFSLPSEFAPEALAPVLPGGADDKAEPADVPFTKYDVQLVRYIAWLNAALLLLFLWALLAPLIVLLRAVDGYDGSGALALVPMFLQTVWTAAFCISCRRRRCSFRSTINLRMTHQMSIVLVTSALVSRVIAARTMCRLKGRLMLQPGESDPFAACQRGLVISDGVVGPLYAATTVLMLQVLAQLESSLRRRLATPPTPPLLSKGLGGSGVYMRPPQFGARASTSVGGDIGERQASTYDAIYGDMNWIYGQEDGENKNPGNP